MVVVSTFELGSDVYAQTDWLPTHLLVIHIILLFAVLNPLIIPFGFVYFCMEAGMSTILISTGLNV